MVQKKLRKKELPLSPLEEVEVFVDEFRSALARGEFDPYLYELIEAVDGRASDLLQFSVEEPDKFMTAFLRRVRHLRAGPPDLVPDACYGLLGAAYTGVVVRYLESFEGKVRVEIVQNGGHPKLVRGNTYRIPETALDRMVDELEGK